MKIRILLTALAAALALGACGQGGGNQAKTPESTVKETEAKKEETSAETEKNAAETEKNAADAKESTAAETGETGEENLGEFYAVPENGMIDLPTFGMKITLPDSLKDDSSAIAAYGFVDTDFAYGLGYVVDENDPENRSMELTEIYGYRDKPDLSEFENPETGLTGDMMMDLGDNGTFYYTGLKLNEVYEKNPGIVEPLLENVTSEEQKNRYLELIPGSAELLKGIELTPVTIPDPPKAAEVSGAEIMKMEVMDLSKNPVKLGSLISGNKVTMLNFWGTFCGPCIGEMPGLGDLERKYKDQGFEILGLTSDIVDYQGNMDEDLIGEAEDIAADTGVTYPILITSKELMDYTQLMAFPTTYFVDAQGNMLRDPVVGSQSKESWEKIITELLEAQK